MYSSKCNKNVSSLIFDHTSINNNIKTKGFSKLKPFVSLASNYSRTLIHLSIQSPNFANQFGGSDVPNNGDFWMSAFNRSYSIVHCRKHKGICSVDLDHQLGFDLFQL